MKTALISLVLIVSTLPALAKPGLCVGYFERNLEQKIAGPKVVVISGTNREGASSLKVANTMRDFLEKEGATVEVLDLAKVPPSTYSSTNYFNTPKVFKQKYDTKIGEAQSIVIIVPEYYGSFPGVLKTFFDYVQAPLAGKPVTMIGVSSGKWGARSAISMFAETLVHRKASVSGETRVNIENVDGKLNESEVKDPQVRKRMRGAARDIVKGLDVSPSERIHGEALAKVTGLDVVSRLTLNSGLEVSGKFAAVILEPRSKEPIYLQYSGPTRLLENNRVHEGQDADVHSTGFGTPIGILKNGVRLSHLKSADDLKAIGLVPGQRAKLEFRSGVIVEGDYVGFQKGEAGDLQILTWKKCKVTLGEKVLFAPSWGTFDMAVGEFVQKLSL